MPFAYGVKVTGCTVHVATLEVDHGPILAQRAVDVLPGDTEATLARAHQRSRALALCSNHPSDSRERICPVSAPRALLSVFDKNGITELAEGLHALGWEIVSSGGTAKAIAAEAIPVVDVSDVTGYPIMLGHRVVTLHPKIHGGILADLDDATHRADLEAHEIEPFALVVVNVYPFTSQPGIEMIDIGGPTMIRAAAKNHAHVGVVVDPADYPTVLEELQAERDTERRHPPVACPQGVRVDRVLRRRDRVVVRSDRPWTRRIGDDPLPLVAAPRRRSRARPSLRREPASGRRPLSLPRRERVGGTPPSSTAVKSSPT